MEDHSASPTAPEKATTVLRQCGLDGLVVKETRRLRGGMVSRVEEWLSDGSPGTLVCKLSEEAGGLEHERRTLQWMREHTDFPMPRVYGYVSGEAAEGGACLVLERLPGRNLGEARLTAEGMEAVQRQIAEHLAALHAYRGDSYGLVAEGEHESEWLDWFGPRFRSNYDDARARLSEEARGIVARLLDELPEWLPEPHAPTLVHGDIWHTNVMVDDSDPDRPGVTGYIDGGGLFADVEYELAYLLVFGLVDERFFRAYVQWHELREGFERRCRVYWLNTMLLHLWLFGDDYLPRCESLAREIAGMKG